MLPSELPMELTAAIGVIRKLINTPKTYDKVTVPVIPVPSSIGNIMLEAQAGTFMSFATKPIDMQPERKIRKDTFILRKVC